MERSRGCTDAPYPNDEASTSATTSSRPTLAHVSGVLDALEAPTCAVDEAGRIVLCNAAWERVARDNDGPLDCTALNYLAVCDDVAATTPATGTDHLDAASVAAGLRGVLAGTVEHFVHDYPCHTPREQRWASVRVTPWRVDGRLGAAVTHIDVTERHLAQTALEHLALHDELTGLPNRTLLRERIRSALQDAAQDESTVAVAFVDLDAFTRVNRSLGHTAGDALLVQVGWRLSMQLGEVGTVARFGGDQFVVLWRHVRGQEHAEQLTEQLRDCLAPSFELDEVPVSLSASIGLATSTASTTSEQLLHAADAAMHQAKRHGRGRVVSHSRDVREGVAQRLVVEAELRTALEQDQLVLHYQPVVDLVEGRAVGVEALMRWQHPDRGLLPPGDFIPVAEAGGLIADLGGWSLRRACLDLASLEGAPPHFYVAVNLSAVQLRNRAVVGQVREVLAETGLDPRRLSLEVTESAIVEDEEVAGAVLHELHAMGVRIAIDDFGTGFSSLLYVRRYPISTIKIDRAFVSPLPDSPDDEAICSSVISLSEAVGATTVAEGIETIEQCHVLTELRCRFGQGFLWSPAVPLADLPAVIAACRATPPPLPGRRRRRRVPLAALEPGALERMHVLQRSGASLHTIAAALNTDGWQAPRGQRWTATTVAHHLQG